METSTTTKLTPAQYAAKIINNTNRHLFLTGKAGTGKTTFLKSIIHQTHKRTIVVAPTGIAAINAGGVTIHSQFQLPFGSFIPVRHSNFPDLPNVKFNTQDSIFRNFHMNKSKRQVLAEVELLIIDEVSMVRADLLDAVDVVLRFVRRNQLPFGGVQVLFIGDLHQLPPVVRDEEWRILQQYYNSLMFFDALVLKKERPLYVELDKIYRQNDLVFINLLNNLRNDEIMESDIDLLNQYYVPGLDINDHKNTIFLTTHNYKADARNKHALKSLPGKSFIYNADIKGEFNESSYPADPHLELKAGAQIMFIKNDPHGEQRFFNGRIATVKALNKDSITVQFEELWDTLELERYEWKNIRYEHNAETGDINEQVIGSFTQYPIKLAWAITVHKSQGLTFEKAILDINDSFAPGQIYVALSRLKSLDGLLLTTPFRKYSIKQDDVLFDFQKSKEKQGNLDEILDMGTKEFLKSYLLRSFNFAGIQAFLKTHSESYLETEGQSNKKKYKPWAIEILKEFEVERNHADRFIQEIKKILSDQEGHYSDRLKKRLEAAVTYFTLKMKVFSENTYQHKLKVRVEKKMKTYLKELEEIEMLFLRHIKEMNKAVVLAESIINNVDFNKQSLNEALAKIAPELNLSRREESENEDAPSSKKAKEKSNQPNTKQISFDLFNEGNSIIEIAEKRAMAISTIEGHLAHYISTGELDYSLIINEEKAKKIIEIAESMDKPALKDLREKLGDDFSYSDIKFANALKKLMESKGRLKG